MAFATTHTLDVVGGGEKEQNGLTATPTIEVN
jgi:hypothetical protein